MRDALPVFRKATIISTEYSGISNGLAPCVSCVQLRWKESCIRSCQALWLKILDDGQSLGLKDPLRTADGGNENASRKGYRA